MESTASRPMVQCLMESPWGPHCWALALPTFPTVCPSLHSSAHLTPPRLPATAGRQVESSSSTIILQRAAAIWWLPWSHKRPVQSMCINCCAYLYVPQVEAAAEPEPEPEQPEAADSWEEVAVDDWEAMDVNEIKLPVQVGSRTAVALPGVSVCSKARLY